MLTALVVSVGAPAHAGLVTGCDMPPDPGARGTTVGPVGNLQHHLSVDGDVASGKVYVRGGTHGGGLPRSTAQTVVFVSASPSGAEVAAWRSGTAAAGVPTDVDARASISGGGPSACVADPDREVGVAVP